MVTHFGARPIRARVSTPRQLFRRSRQILCRELAAQWQGTRAELKSAISRFLKPLRHRWDLLVAMLCEPMRAGLLAAAIALGCAPFAFSTAHATAPIQLTSVTLGLGGFAINGEAAHNYASLVAGAGDVNGDGLNDLLIAAQDAAPNGTDSGRCYVVLGKTTTSLVNLSAITVGTGGFALNGEALFNYAGRSISSAGDVNGDGIDDFLVGAPGASPYGRTYVVFGKASGTTINLSAIAAGNGGFVIDGSTDNNFSGGAVAGAGDVNGDGFADIIIGAPSVRPSTSLHSGRSYVVFGKASTTPVNLLSIANGTGGGFLIEGEPVNGYSGTSVAGGGDVNGDGLADVIVGAPFAQPNGPFSGRSYVVFGKTSTTTVTLAGVAAGTGGFAINGNGSSEQSGISVSNAGDVNGDGLADVLVGAPNGSPNGVGSGRSYVVFGKTGTAQVDLLSVAAGTGGFAIGGEAAGNHAGGAVSGAGDVNGDGFADLLVGALEASPRGTYSGRSYVVFGKSSTSAVNLSSVAAGTGGFAIDGETSETFSGGSVAGAGDTNGDGLPDLLIGASHASPNGQYSGKSYLVFSPATAPASAPYLARTLAGDGPGGSIVPPTQMRDARVRIDYSDNDTGNNGAGGASLETVTLTRNKSAVSGAGLPRAADIANVIWQIQTDRVNWASADVTLKYEDSEIAGLAAGESNLAIFKSSAPAGPWTRLPSTTNAGRNEIKATVTGFSYFIIGSGTAVNESKLWEAYE